MPQLFSRMDDMNWLTPSIADILDQGTAPPGGDGTIREQLTTLQDELAALETPVKVVNVRPTPSYNLFIVQPDQVGKRGNRRTVSIPELRRSVGQVAEKHPEWKLGFLSQLEEAPDVIGLFLRSDKHRPLSLRRLLVQSAYRNHPSTAAFTLGVTLEQQLIVRDLENTPHLLVVGESSARQYAISGILLTLILLNTPAEIRIAVQGQGSEAYRSLANLPHSLGQHSTVPEEIQRFIEGISAEVQRRLDGFYTEGVNSLSAYNARLREKGEQSLPEMVVVLDSLSDADLQPIMPQLAPLLRDIVLNGAQSGIHLILAVNKRDDLPRELRNTIPTQVVMRSSAPELGDQVKNFHSSLLRFIDAFVVDTETSQVTPVELSAVSTAEIRQTVDYWLAAVSQRKQEAPNAEISARTGVTGLLSPAALSQLSTEEAPTVEAPRVAVPAPQQQPSQFHARARMLAAYLGWLSTGALCDIFGLTENEARLLLSQLQAEGVIESGDGMMLRFVRLADNPLSQVN